jgi:hypothetical protein
MNGKTVRRSNKDLPTFEQEVAPVPGLWALFEHLREYTLGLGTMYGRGNGNMPLTFGLVQIILTLRISLAWK